MSMDAEVWPGTYLKQQVDNLFSPSATVVFGPFLFCMPSGERYFKMPVRKKWDKHISCTSHSLHHNSSVRVPSYHSQLLMRLPLSSATVFGVRACGQLLRLLQANQLMPHEMKRGQRSSTLTAAWQGVTQKVCFRSNLNSASYGGDSQIRHLSPRI